MKKQYNEMAAAKQKALADERKRSSLLGKKIIFNQGP